MGKRIACMAAIALLVSDWQGQTPSFDLRLTRLADKNARIVAELAPAEDAEFWQWLAEVLDAPSLAEPAPGPYPHYERSELSLTVNGRAQRLPEARVGKGSIKPSADPVIALEE